MNSLKLNQRLTNFLICLFFLLITQSIFAQDVNLSSQAELNAFSVPANGIHDGDLLITGTDITDLSNLSSLIGVTGSFQLSDLNILTDLSGLENLQSIGGNFTLANNALLSSLAPLSNLSEVEGEIIFIILNNALTNLDGLEGIQSEIGTLMIFQNPVLENVDGLSGLSAITSEINFLLNPSLLNVDGLANADINVEGLFIQASESLIQIDGLANATVSDGLSIVGTDISNIDVLSSITDNLETVIIASNPNLSNLNGIANLGVETLLVIDDNAQLADCCGALDPLINSQNAPANVTISNNLPGCNSEQEIIDDCGDGCSGTIFINSQVELNELMPCDTIFGDLMIIGSDITDLNALSNLSVVTGDLSVTLTTDLINFQGLENLESIGGSLLVSSNEGLINFFGLNNLNSINIGLNVQNNAVLTNISDLNSLTGEIENIVLFGNSFTEISGPTFTSISVAISISTGMVSDLDFLSTVTNPVNSLSLSMVGLTDLSGISNIPFINNIEIVNTDLENLNAISQLGGDIETLTIAANSQLTNINGLSNITSVTENLTIASNSMLDDCCGISDLVNDPPNVIIDSNLANCASANAIFTNCNDLSGPADLELTLESLTPDPLVIYEFYDFELTVTNNGPGSASNIIVNFPVPEGFAFTSSNAGFRYFSFTGEWTPEEILLPGESITLEVRLFSLTESIPIQVYAEIKSSDSVDPDSTPNNGTCCTITEDDEDVVVVTPENLITLNADLELTGSIDQQVVEEGDIINVNLTLTNTGPDMASAVEVRFFADVFDPEFFGIARIVPGSIEISGGSLFSPFWRVGEILPGISQTLSYQIIIEAPLEEPLDLFFEVTESVINDPDSTPNNGEPGMAMEDDEVSFTLIPGNPQNVNPPVPTLTTAIGNVTAPFTVDVNFTKPVTGLELGDFDITNGTISNLFGNGIAYSVLITPNAIGAVSLNLPADVVTDAVGNGNLGSNILNVNFQPPTNGTGPDLELSMTSNMNFSPIFSNVDFTLVLTNTGVAPANNITVEVPFPNDLAYVSDEAIDGSFNISFREWNINTLAPGASATLNLTLFTLVDQSVPTTLYGQVLEASPQDNDSTPGNWVCVPQGVLGCIPNEDDEASLTLNVEEAPDNPTVVIATPSSSVSGPFEVSINFNKPVTGLTASDFNIGNGSANNLSGSGSSYTITITPNFSGNVNVVLPANIAIDADNNSNLGSNQLSVNFSAPPGNETDLELSMSSLETGFDQNDFITISLRVENTSSVDATNVVIEYPKPESTAFTSLNLTNGSYADFTGEWVIGNIPAGGVEVLEVTWFTLTGAEFVDAYAQVLTASPNDFDSTPGNGTCCIAVEDDEAALSFESNIQSANRSLDSSVIGSTIEEQNKSLKMLAPFPNPIVDRMNLVFYVPEPQILNVQLQNVLGEVVLKSTLELNDEVERKAIDISHLPSGIYYLTTDQKGKRAPQAVMKGEF